jgi:hypothetical protein
LPEQRELAVRWTHCVREADCGRAGPIVAGRAWKERAIAGSRVGEVLGPADERRRHVVRQSNGLPKRRIPGAVCHPGDIHGIDGSEIVTVLRRLSRS